ncbi:Hypothetical predicted protein [Olea europaea subsp. europaea]|uniref:Uncharacterized protein n=1 Tax=Olea europaea subsp. europaea TaxID=158383 RepID=A0A8S0URG7_OLEEU|nr:Hypothetical predicted protein [Olea europaea subsp. europaea]
MIQAQMNLGFCYLTRYPDNFFKEAEFPILTDKGYKMIEVYARLSVHELEKCTLQCQLQAVSQYFLLIS